MSSYEMLIACGYSKAEAERISGRKAPAKPISQVAAENEARYSGVKNVLDDYVGRRFSGDTYGRIMEGSDNGNCTTRRGTYMKLKTGDGRCDSDASVHDRRKIDANMRHRTNGQFKRNDEK